MLRYTVVKISGQLGHQQAFIANTSQVLNAMAQDGWRLVTVDQFWAYLEREEQQ